MKVLTIKQPWATLIMQGDKRFEFRSWQTKYRGDLLIHAGKGIDKEAMKRLSKYITEDLPAGKILGKVTLVDCVKMSQECKDILLKENKDIYTDSSFKENYGWQLENVEVFDEVFKKEMETNEHLSDDFRKVVEKEIEAYEKALDKSTSEEERKIIYDKLEKVVEDAKKKYDDSMANNKE